MNQLVAGTRATGIVPGSFEDVQRVAKALVAAGVGSFTKKDDDSTKVAKTTAQIMTGLELGVPPMRAISNITIVNGRPMIWGELAVGLILARGFEFDSGCTGNGEDRVGWATVKRPGATNVHRVEFTAEQAREAGLWDTRAEVPDRWNNGKPKPNDAPWYRYKNDMLAWKATARVLKRAAADVLSGVVLHEDMEGVNEPIDITPEVVTKPEPEGLPPELEEMFADVPETIEPTQPAPEGEETEAKEAIADESGLLTKIEEDLATTGNEPTAVNEYRDQYAELIGRMSKEGQLEANELFESALS